MFHTIKQVYMARDEYAWTYKAVNARVRQYIGSL